jgi:hypothetical protein
VAGQIILGANYTFDKAAAFRGSNAARLGFCIWQSPAALLRPLGVFTLDNPITFCWVGSLCAVALCSERDRGRGHRKQSPARRVVLVVVVVGAL